MAEQLNEDELYMLRALELAILGMGQVSPNPLVGCVIVHEGKIIGEGWHKKFGEAHAEVNAVNSVRHKTLLRESTVYVTLEPCSHFGKTPPCADMLVRKQVKKVVIANVDSNPIVSGKGIEKLRAGGINVTTGVLEAQACEMNRRFFTFVEKKRPYIILKWAQTSDGFIGRENYDSKWISDEFSRQLVHKWRSEEDAILVGSNTAQHDDPSLNVRLWTGRNPVRIVIDRFLKLPPSLKIFDQSQQTICYNVFRSEQKNNLELVKVSENNFITDLLTDLYNRKIQSVVIEGGEQILNAFIKTDLWDEARVFTAPATFEKGISAPEIKTGFQGEESLSTDTLRIFRNHSLGM
jgi:diaminohydroxyphosphoribosylaminopyrimidine deaminase/5-amino-6-(5-phosphoribosylamino)uracil reductase